MTITPDQLNNILADPLTSPANKPLGLRYLTIDQVKQLNADDENWREHPQSQADYLVATMQDIEDRTDDGIKGRGWNDALKYNVRLNKFKDGHLRQEVIDRLINTTTNDGRVPVLFGAWNEEQHRIGLLTIDPLAGMATANTALLEGLITVTKQLDGIEPNTSLDNLLTHLAHDHGINLEAGWQGKTPINPATIPVYDADKEVVQVRVSKVSVADKEAVVEAINMLLEDCWPGQYKAEVF